MKELNQELSNFSRQYQEQFKQQKMILSFEGFLEVVQEKPRLLLRNASEYLLNVFEQGGFYDTQIGHVKAKRYKIFDLPISRISQIVGCESVQNNIASILKSFVRQGSSSRLLILHGPNGSAKSSTIEAIATSMQKYSETDDGAVYRFSWVFPTEKIAHTRMKGETSPIGLGARDEMREDRWDTFAFLDESDLACKIHSEFKDNPIFLIPMPQRERWLKEWVANKEKISIDEVKLPAHILKFGLSKRNQLIFENLMNAYEGNFNKVMRHVQVERFYYSQQYRVGISKVEPQMSVDAHEKQLTMQKHFANLPTSLQNITFYEASGELVEANRGMLEFSDMLKRPLEAYKYLLSTVENSNVQLPSSNANLDLVFFATTNEKQLDAFKTVPEFASFRGRIELVTVPYLLLPSQEKKIYEQDLEALKKSCRVLPHVLDLLCQWAVMTRLKQPDPEVYDQRYRTLISRLDPRSKIRLYEGESLIPGFTMDEMQVLKETARKIYSESLGYVVYEGRFGASPRELRNILYRASQNNNHMGNTLTPMSVFSELDNLLKDRTVYEFLQFEPRGKYHDVAFFNRVIKDEFCDLFFEEIRQSMNLVDIQQYDQLLRRYIDHSMAFVKKEKIYNSNTNSHEPPSPRIMDEVEKIIGVQTSPEKFRENLLTRIASFKIERPNEELDISRIFVDILNKIKGHYYKEKEVIIEDNIKCMQMMGTDEQRHLSEKQKSLAQETFSNLDKKYGYDESSVRECLKFVMIQAKDRKLKQ